MFDESLDSQTELIFPISGESIVTRKEMAKPRTMIFNSCSILMASLFALSASVQFNDPDWYFWFPLYATASAVNLANAISAKKRLRRSAEFTLGLGLFLLMKVLMQDYAKTKEEFWSLDMRERGVRETFGSGLVVVSMLVQLKALSVPNSNNTTHANEAKAAKQVEYGMVSLVCISYGISFIFFKFQKPDMRF